MANRYELLTEAQMRDALARSKWTGRQALRDDFAFAIDMMENRQRAHTEHELGRRYPSRQKTAHPIQAVTVPLTRRYITEAASAYSGTVHRELIDEGGNVDERATDELNRALDAIAYDKHMHRVEQVMVLCRTAINWYQVKRGKLKPVLALPHDVYPVMGESENIQDAADPDDYLAHVVELTAAASQARTADNRTFAWVSPAETAFYTGPGPFEVKSAVASYDNPFRWPQVPEAAVNEAKPAKVMLPLSPFVWWHDSDPMGGLVNDNDVDIARLNLEVNVQLSVLFDTIGHQGWGQAVIHAINPDTAPAVVTAGATQAICLGAEETMEYLQSGAPYESIVSALRFFIQLEALASRQSPNDFSIDGPVATSGFAKMVDSLPKLEARSEKVAQLTRIEATQVWPQLATKLSYLGQLSGTVERLSRLRLRATFAPVKFPESTSEQAQRETHELEKGLVKRSVLIAKREGVPVEEVEERLQREVEEAAAAVEDARPGLTGEGLDDKVQETALNGGQVASMVDVVVKTAGGELPRDAGLSILQTAFQLSPEQAASNMGSAGAGFVPSTKNEGASATPPPAGPPTKAEEPPPEEPKKGRLSDALGGLIGRRRRGE